MGLFLGISLFQVTQLCLGGPVILFFHKLQGVLFLTERLSGWSYKAKVPVREGASGSEIVKVKPAKKSGPSEHSAAVEGTKTPFQA